MRKKRSCRHVLPARDQARATVEELPMYGRSASTVQWSAAAIDPHLQHGGSDGSTSTRQRTIPPATL